MADEEQEFGVTVVSEYFYPDVAGSGARITELATGLVDRGAAVSVLTSQPSYSSLDRDREQQPKRETYQGVEIRRLFATRFDKDRFLGRAVNNVSFFFSAFVSLLFRPRDDVVLLTTLPPFLPLLGIPLSYLPGRRYAILVHDIHPPMAAKLGFLSRDSLVYRFWERLNVLAYSRADAISVLGDTMKRTVERRYDPECEVTVIHNWEDADRIRPMEKEENEFSQEHDLVDPLTVLYSGNIGRFHDLETAVEAAKVLDERRPNADEEVTFLFIGEGGKKPVLREAAREYDLANVEFLPYQSHDRLPFSLTCGDVALVSVDPAVTGLCVSGKFYTALASGQAILAVVEPESEIGRIVDETGCGIRVNPGSPEQIADAIEDWLSNPETCERMGSRARELAEDRYSKGAAIDDHYRLLEDIAPNASGT